VIKLLLSKAEYKYVTESEWKPGVSPTAAAVKALDAGGSAELINAATTAQVELVKKLESEKPAMPKFDEAKELLHLKAEYIAVTGSVCKSGEPHGPAVVEALHARAINVASSDQSVLETKLKFEKAQSELDEAVTKLKTQKA
jgi:bifunctional glutamyl/prolyl-tRNA synthetase